MRVGLAKDDFFNKNQKEIKQKIIQDLLITLFSNIEKNEELFDEKTACDLVVTCLMVFFREVMTHFFIFSDAYNMRTQILDSMFDSIKKEIKSSLKKHKESHAC